MTTPSVSVCVVTYNHEHYIHDCLMSVVAQTHDVFLEILIGDDQSIDQTEAIVRTLAAQFPTIIRYFRHENRLGAAGNYQFLIGQARGEYIAHLDGDDFWLPGKLLAQLGALNASPECVAAYTNAICINDTGLLLGLFNNPVPDRFDLSSLLRYGNFLNHSSLIYRATFGEMIRGWPPEFIDYRIHLALACHGQLVYLKSPYVGYRVNSSGSMLTHQSEHVRELYWSAVRESLTCTKDKKIKMAAVADFLSGVFFRAREIGRLKFFVKWWQVIIQEFECNKFQLAIWTASIVIRRRLGSLLTKYFGRFAGFPFRIFHRR